MQAKFKELGTYFDKNKNNSPLNFFLETQFSFASLILADKKDAGDIEKDDKKNIKNFCNEYNEILNRYLKKLPNQNLPINKLRTEIRKNAVYELYNNLKWNNRVYTLTAPTGSGKTLILLSLAGEILRKKGDFRIIYSLPFLSITEQVESEALEIFSKNRESIQRIDSKSENTEFQKLQEIVENNPTEENIRKLLALNFQEDTFSYPFVITTFVRFFETLLTNKNASLLKLPNFSNSIFLIDEIQALPPRLYSFFLAFLSAFCKKFDSYAIISTATMPYTDLPPEEASNFNAIKEIFSNYSKPIELSKSEYFDYKLFNRYSISKKEISSIEQLALAISQEKQSVLVILNTIDDTKDLFNNDLLIKENIILLNTHFTPNDRKKKIREAKNCLNNGEKVIVVSTQLIEAGVDMDFPVLYRDMATMPSIVQSAGRCNRNGKLKKGSV
ncbi:MAG: CRISPR-associated helicase Cas3', partial [Flavobacteriales bacterium]